MKAEMMTSFLTIWRSNSSRGTAASETEAPLADGAPLAVAQEAVAAGRGPSAAPRVTSRYVAECLEHVVDPEVGINIVDLGLVYAIEVDGPCIRVVLTMTTPACPMSSHIIRFARGILQRIEGVEDVRIDLAWQPRWHPDMIDPEARLRRFGMPDAH